MTAQRSYVANAWETTLTASMGPTDLTATVLSTANGPASPCWLVIEPDKPSTQMEVVFFDGTFTGTTFVTSNVSKRYGTGSAAGSGLTHPVGSIVRSAPVAQLVDDIFDTIDTKVATSAAAELIRDTMGTALVAGSNITITPSDVGDTITITGAAADAAALAAALSEAASVPTAETVANDGVYHAFPTVGPTVSMVTGTEVWVEISAEVFNTNPGAGFVYASIVVTGASSIAAGPTKALVVGPTTYTETRTFGFKLTGLTGGTNNFEMQALHSGSNTPTWGLRHLRITRLN